MKNEILDPEVQKTYYYAKKLLDSQGYTQQLGLYLRLGWRNQPPKWLYLSFIWFFTIICFIGGIILLFKTIIGGIVAIIVGIINMKIFIKRYYSPETLSAVETSSQKIGSHKLMKIVADEMSKESSMEVIVEALKKEIEDTLRTK
jgi:hypothetical protein